MSLTEGITDVLGKWASDGRQALDELMPLVVDELRLLARSHLRREIPNHTLQPTALVNEVYLRFVEQKRVRFLNRSQFFAFASRLMRRVLVDHYRARHTAKRGLAGVTVSLDDAVEVADGGDQSVDLLALDHALDELEALDARQYRIVELRYFGGLTIPQTAEVLDISPATVKREWMTARAWLLHRLRHL